MDAPGTPARGGIDGSAPGARIYYLDGRDPFPCVAPLEPFGFFEHEPRAYAGARVIARAHQDRHGYDHPLVRALWS